MIPDTRELIDLHIHSNCSDGALSPSGLVQRAAQTGLKVIAIADHDSVAGIDEATSAGNSSGIEVLPAVELSVQFKGWHDVHLLGYGIDHTDPEFLKKLHGFRDRREKRNEEILERVNSRLLEESRQPIALASVLAYARDAIGRPHIARALLEQGYVSSVEDAFQRYLVPCNVPKSYWPIDDAIKEIQRIGGVAVLAHPTTVSTDRQELRLILRELAGLGLNGIEAFNNLAQPYEMEFLRRLAEELGLLVTGGSDFHGIEDGLEMGRGRGGIRFSANLLIPLKKQLACRKLAH
jgi:predicted metal-dependent phosphoesterase TrpH